MRHELRTLCLLGQFVLYLFVSWCRLLMTFANSLDSDQARQNVGPELDPNCLTLMVFLKEFFRYVDFEKKSADDKKSVKISQEAESTLIFCIYINRS